jgi:hypothetical protein
MTFGQKTLGQSAEVLYDAGGAYGYCCVLKVNVLIYKDTSISLQEQAV